MTWEYLLKKFDVNDVIAFDVKILRVQRFSVSKYYGHTAIEGENFV